MRAAHRKPPGKRRGGERIDLYRQVLDPTVAQIRELLEERVADRLAA